MVGRGGRKEEAVVWRSPKRRNGEIGKVVCEFIGWIVDRERRGGRNGKVWKEECEFEKA